MGVGSQVRMAVVLSMLMWVPVGASLPFLAAAPQSVLRDPEGNVQYDAAYPGARDHDYIDIIEILISYDEANDLVAVTMQLAGLEDFDGRTEESSLDYSIVGEFLIEDEVVGEFRINYTAFHTDLFGPRTNDANVTFCQAGSFNDCVGIDEATFLRDEATGTMTWSAPRARFQWYGETMGNWRSGTIESYSPQALFNVPIRNLNPVASSQDRFEISALRPPESAGEMVPVAGSEGASEVSRDASQAKTNALGAIAVLACVFIGLAGRRMGRRG